MIRLPAVLALLASSVVSFAEVLTIPIPDQGWQITIDAPPLEKKGGQKQGNKYRYQAVGGNFNLTLFVEPPAKPGDHKACYEHYWKLMSRNPLINQPSVKVSNTDKFYRVEYEMALGGKNVGKHVNYFFSANGKWVDVHISSLDPKPADLAAIAAFDKGLAYSDAKAAPKAK